MTNEEFERLYPAYRGVARGIARKLVGSDDDLVQDLEQEAFFALSQFDLATVTTNVDACIRQLLKFRMVDYLRKLKLDREDSLDMYLDTWDQLVVGADGVVRIVQWHYDGVPPRWEEPT